MFIKLLKLGSALCLAIALTSCSKSGGNNQTATQNVAPTVNAGSNSSVTAGSKVTLLGSASDSDGTIASYAWTQLSGTSVTINNASQASATFTAPNSTATETLSFQLMVTDDDGASASSQVTITVNPQASNNAPTVNAGSSSSVTAGSKATLLGSASDSDGTIVSYAWTQLSGTSVTINNASQASATFTAPNSTATETLSFQLMVTDDDGATASATVDIVISPQIAPTTYHDTQLLRTPFPGTRNAQAVFEFSGPQGASFECRVDSAAFAACTSPHQINVSPGYHDFEVRSVNAGQTDPTPAHWRWEYVNNLATVTSGSPFFVSLNPISVTDIPFNSDLGAFTDSCDALTTLEVNNDQANRINELAWSSVSIPRELNITDTSHLVLIGSNEHRAAVQFRPIARWNASVDDSTAPLKWVEVASVVTMASQSKLHYSLRYCATPPTVSDDKAVTLSQQADGTYIVNTAGNVPNSNAITATLDPSDARLMTQASIGGKQLSSVFNQIDLTSSGQTTGFAIIDSFSIEQSGPVKVVASAQGHFNIQPSANCPKQPGYQLRFTFVRGTGNIDIESHLINECGDGMNPAGPGAANNGSDWWNRVMNITSFHLGYNINLDAATSRSYSNDNYNGNLASSTMGNFGLNSINQLKGQSANGISDWRRASLADGSVIEELELPFTALTDVNTTIMAQMPWMRYREPQSLSSQTNPGLSYINIYPVYTPYSPFVLGEAQGIWNFARLSLFNGSLNTNQMLKYARANQAAMERGLLFHEPVWTLNQNKVFPKLPDLGAPEMTTWASLMDGAHNNTVVDSILPGAQRDRMKGYSLVGWPDIMQEGIKDTLNTSLDEYVPGGNIWSPTNNELLMWYVTGDPKWAWDYALPAEWSFWHTNAYNTGSRGVVGTRNGFVVASAGSGEGARYRSGYGSDDKFYNQGSEKAYLIRPLQSLADRFQAAGDTFIARYTDDAASRQATVSKRTMNRQVVQHLNALQLAARYATHNTTALRNKLDSVMQEYVNDNLFGGTFCFDDNRSVNDTQCVFAFSGIFHYVALWQEVFYNYALDLPATDTKRETILNAIAQTARLIDNGIPRDSNSTISNFSPTAWGNSYQCDFSSGSDLLQQCVQYNCSDLENPPCNVNPMYDNAHLNTLATAMVGHEIDPTLVDSQRCSELKSAFNANLNSSTVGNHMRDSSYGWHKDSAQMGQMTLYGIAAAQTCP